MTASVSATLAANEAISQRRRDGLPVLPMAFGEAGLPVHPAMREALSAGGGQNAYGPVAGTSRLRRAAAGYWDRRDLPTDPDLVVAGPGSKPLLYALMLALGGDIAVASPSWVSYAAQARISGHAPLFVPTPPAQGGIPEPDLLAAAVTEARERGRTVRGVITTLPDNPTGTLPERGTVRRLARVARELDLVIISDEIYRDLIHDPDARVSTPAEFAPERTVTSTGVSKSLALGGWRLGVVRLPDSPVGWELRDAVLAAASEIWSSPAAPVQRAAAYAFDEPPEIAEYVARGRRLHRTVARAVADRFCTAGAMLVPPQAAFYLYPDFEAWRERLYVGHGIETGPELTRHLLSEYGMGVLPASVFGEAESALRTRVSVSLLYGDTDEQRTEALDAADPLELPWIRGHVDRLAHILADLGPMD
jgi:aspartate aminotransferase